MKSEKELLEEQYAELADFCFRRLVNLESRFIRLCMRAEAVGISCSDLQNTDRSEPESEVKLKILN